LQSGDWLVEESFNHLVSVEERDAPSFRQAPSDGRLAYATYTSEEDSHLRLPIAVMMRHPPVFFPADS
jgi:hypothetical protein